MTRPGGTEERILSFRTTPVPSAPDGTSEGLALLFTFHTLPAPAALARRHTIDGSHCDAQGTTRDMAADMLQVGANLPGTLPELFHPGVQALSSAASLACVFCANRAARGLLQDPNYFGTMAVAAGDADGMVSGYGASRWSGIQALEVGIQLSAVLLQKKLGLRGVQEHLATALRGLAATRFKRAPLSRLLGAGSG